MVRSCFLSSLSPPGHQGLEHPRHGRSAQRLSLLSSTLLEDGLSMFTLHWVMNGLKSRAQSLVVNGAV